MKSYTKNYPIGPRLARKSYSIVRYILIARLAGKRLRTLAEKASNPKDVVDIAFEFSFKDPIASLIFRRSVYVDIKPSQVREEILKLVEIVADLRPKRVLEIGTAWGGPSSCGAGWPRMMPRL